jgi:hypothetical protein
MRPRWRRHSANVAIGQGCLPAPMKCRITMLFVAVHEHVVDPDLGSPRSLQCLLSRGSWRDSSVWEWYPCHWR